MKNQKGFTLAELLGVLTILAIIALITVPLVNKYITSSRQKAYDAEMSTLKTAAQQWFVKNSSSVVWDEDGYYALNLDVLKQSEFLADEVIYNPLSPNEAIIGCIMIENNNGNYSYEYDDDCIINNEYTFNYNGTNGSDGSVQTLTITKDGNYQITAAGAGGAIGNTYNLASYTSTAGKGAELISTFALKNGDILYIVVGGKGSTTTGTSTDGASGAGGGGTFIFKKISSVTNANYQFSKESTSYEVLLVAAGGGGTCDLSYSGSSCSGYSGIGATWYSPSNYAAFSTTTASSSSSSNNTSVLGISQFISYNLYGNIYTRDTSYCKGGYGGGACADDSAAPGGGWSLSSRAATSFANGTSTSGTTGLNAGNGYAKITKIS